jgi:hypothetical protein
MKFDKENEEGLCYYEFMRFSVFTLNSFFANSPIELEYPLEYVTVFEFLPPRNVPNFSPYRKVDLHLSLYHLQSNLGSLNEAALAIANVGAFHTTLSIYDTEISYCEGDGT